MSNEEHITLLKQGAEEWNQWQMKQKKLIPNLEKANLSQLNLSGINLTGANLNHANLSNTDLSHAKLVDANLLRANLLGADLRGADLRGANLDYAIFLEAKIDAKTAIAKHSRKVWEIVNNQANNQDFSGIDLSNSNLFRVDLSNANLSHCQLENANLNSANLEDAYLYKANLTGANLQNANLKNAYFSHANLTKVYLAGAYCGGTYFKDAQLQFADFKTAKLSHQTIIDPKWYSVWEIVNRGAVKKNLTGVDLSRANLQEVNFESANLTNANLSHAILRRSNLDRANLTNTALIGANICGVDLDQANLKGTKLKAIICDRNTQLPTTINNSKTNLIVQENPEIKPELISRFSSAKKYSTQAFVRLLFLGIIGLIIAGGYLFLNNNSNNHPIFQGQQKLEQLLPGVNKD